MIISRTPYRLSFFGGGTDYPLWFEQNKGAVLATTIDKYCYITCRYLPPFFEHKSRIIYSKMEHINRVEEIDHPAVREVLKYLKIHEGVEIHHDGDLPARSGLGTSSSFTVGLLNSLYALKGIMTTKESLAREAIYIEQECCRENVGCQDQVLAAYGGFNLVEFGGTDHLQVRQVTLPDERFRDLQDHTMLFFTGFHRPDRDRKKVKKVAAGMGDQKENKRATSSDIIAHQIARIPDKTQDYRSLYQMVFHALELLNGGRIAAFGKLLHEAWLIKRTLSERITTGHIDDIYEAARRAGALGGKILGAGGGGFLMVFARPSDQAKIRAKLGKLLEIPCRFECQGSQIIFYQPFSGRVV